MRKLKNIEIDQVNGGCEEHCWGDFSVEGLSSAISAGGLINSYIGLAGGVTYLFAVMWFDLK